MRQKRAAGTGGAEKTIRDIRRATRRLYSAEEKIRIVLDGLRGEVRIRALSGPGIHYKFIAMVVFAIVIFLQCGHRTLNTWHPRENRVGYVLGWIRLETVLL